jgi:hypothetical protein
LFKTIKNSILTKQSVFTLVRNLKDTADLFLAIQNPDDEFWKSNPEIKESLNELKLFQIKQTNSLLLAGYNNLDINDFRKLVSVCSIISFRYNVIGGLNPNAQEDVYNSIALKINDNKQFDIHDFQSIYISDSNFENDFATKAFKSTTRNHKIVKYIFSKIEEYKFRNEISLDSDLFSIEHILPESADEQWGEFSQEEINRSVYRIGNLTLLEKKLNKTVDTLPYSEKIKRYEESNSRLTQSIPEHYDSWSESKVLARQKAIAREAKAIWKIQGLL